MTRSTGRGDHPIRSQLLRMNSLRPGHTPATIGSPWCAAMSDFWFGLPPAKVFDIPYTWISPEVRFRPDAPVNEFTATSTNGGHARSTSQTSITDYGVWAERRELNSAVDRDPKNLAAHMVAMYASPRARLALIRMTLKLRTELEQQTILSVDVGSRIEITGTPVTWPLGAHKLTVEGVRHIVEQDNRIVEWRTSPMIGTVHGEVGPWFQLDVSPLDGTHKLAY